MQQASHATFNLALLECIALLGYVCINPFAHTFYKLPRRFVMSEPSAAAARLQVLGMAGYFVGPLAATRRHSDRLGFDRLAHAGLGCFMMRDAPHVLLEATDVNVGFR